MTGTSTSPSPEAPTGVRRCDNCGSQLLGEHCYACGQPTKGLVRHFSSILGDFADSVFNFDTRTFRTLGPLLFRPGYLSREYFHGHRVRYVSPVRLFFFLCIGAFFAVRLAMPEWQPDAGDASRNAIAQAGSVAEVEKLRDDALGELRKARSEVPDAPGARVGLDVAIGMLEDEAEDRIEWLRLRDAALARGESPPPYEGNVGFVITDDDGEDDRKPDRNAAAASATDARGHTPAGTPSVAAAADADTTRDDEAAEKAPDGPRVRTRGPRFNDRPWDADSNPVTLDFLPPAGNALLNRLIGRAVANAERINKQPTLLRDAFLGSLPQTLFVLLPVFALLLKIFYLFKRRLYMEHLIVALHSHAFLCAATLLLVGLIALRDALGAGLASTALGWLMGLWIAWMPIYLLLMQKRVYGQGWIMTSLKYVVLGNLYLVLLSLGAAINLAISVVAL